MFVQYGRRSLGTGRDNHTHTHTHTCSAWHLRSPGLLRLPNDPNAKQSWRQKLQKVGMRICIRVWLHSRRNVENWLQSASGLDKATNRVSGFLRFHPKLWRGPSLIKLPSVDKKVHSGSGCRSKNPYIYSFRMLSASVS